jgi:hypothetical protein
MSYRSKGLEDILRIWEWEYLWVLLLVVLNLVSIIRPSSKLSRTIRI